MSPGFSGRRWPLCPGAAVGIAWHVGTVPGVEGEVVL